ncbi:hypothetical protein CIG75_07175 [Tumebacillus algifaecis]|uniref:DUF58 domain-containing protein n=1 Tax=Tumebacillus algifaecis TaxID=1214604 RepID=A0A223CZ93_9BACL|nr:DUF58 domain-containing protein [Tumebacillus algifaecis]ASS74779.1 hypothetical protein CIG75_07175 [Tumebacillus algifaecis]
MSALLWVVALVAVIYGYSKLWERYTAGKIKLTIRIDEEIIYDGEEVEVWTVLENESWLPIPWLELLMGLPSSLRVIEGAEEKEEIAYRTFLLPRQRVQRMHKVRVKRGTHRLVNAEIQYGDGIGLKGMFEQLHLFGRIQVRPRVAEEFDIDLRLQELVGEKSVVRWYQEDSSRLIGIRSYMQGDPYKAIHWRATARTGELMVKQFDTTSETDFYVVMNVQFFATYWWGTIKEVVEQQCRIAAKLFQRAEEQAFPFGLYTNASWSGAGSLHIPLQSLPGQMDAVLAALGDLSYKPNSPFEDILRNLRGRLHNRSTLVVITPYWDDRIAREVEMLRSEGHQLLLIASDHIADQLPGLSPSIPVVPLHVENAEVEQLEGQGGSEEVPA